jgi:hypothetical protein
MTNKSDGGRSYFLVARTLFEHPFFEAGPYSEREAWQWLIMRAAWSPFRRDVGQGSIVLQRGQLAVSTRFLADAWQWHRSRVQRFLQRLERENMVTLAVRVPTRTGSDADPPSEPPSDPPLGVITICNYDKYQGSLSAADPPSDPPTEPKNIKSHLHQVGTPSPSFTLAQNLADEIAKACGYDLAFVPPPWCGAAMRIEGKWFPAGWTREKVMPFVLDAIARKKDGPPANINYFERVIAKGLARADAPLPEIQAGDSREGSGHVKRRSSTDRSIVAGIERTKARILAAGQPGNGDGSRGDIVQIVPKGGSRRS